MEVELHPQARQEFIEASSYYESRIAGLGAEYIDELERLKRRLRDYPEIGASISPVFRKASFRRFPYSLVYVIEQTRILVVAVAHHRRKPGFWRDRYEHF